MRNIEEIAAEEEARDRRTRIRRLQILCTAAGVGLSVWGWVLFYQGNMGKGSLWVGLGLDLLALTWGLARALRTSWPALGFGLLGGAFPLILYLVTGLPSFYWGKDPSFWLSVNAGAVAAPAWSPLSYLLGQAACFTLAGREFSLLPGLSALVAALSLYLLVQDYFARLKNKTLPGMALALLAAWTLGLSLPYWNAGTMGSGLVAGLGLLLFLLQRSLLELEERPWKPLYLLLGLLWAVHPLWGLLGTIRHLGSLDFEGRKMKPNLFPFLMGWTPFLWVAFRAGRFFPSWGGGHPFTELLKTSWLPVGPGIAGVFPSLGWILAAWALALSVLGPLYFLRWRTVGRHLVSPLDFWIWILSGAGAILYSSTGGQCLGPTALWFAAGAGEVGLKLLERGMEKRQPAAASGARLGWMAAVFLALTLALSGLRGQHLQRSRFYFPLQHALNLLQGLGKKSVLVCDDPFDAAACREAREIEPIALEAVILDRQYLNRRWYVAQCIDRVPQLLFSEVQAPTDTVLKSLVLTNRDGWDIQWDRPALPDDWKGLPAVPTVLTLRFQGAANFQLDPADSQYRYDLTVLPSADALPDPETARYRSRYVVGFNQVGVFLMNQGRYSAAIHAFERSVKLDPSYPAPQQALEEMYSRHNILEAARLEFEKTVKTHPQQIAALEKALGTAEKAQDVGRTESLLDQMIHLNAELADAQYQLSKIYDKEGRPREAKALLESSVKLNPRQVEAQLTLGHLMAQTGNRIKAEEAFRAVLVVDPQNKEAQAELWKLLNKP